VQGDWQMAQMQWLLADSEIEREIRFVDICDKAWNRESYFWRENIS